MKKSIESVWKEGFLKTDALVAPKVNNLYNQKSIDIVDKFKRMFKINRISIIVFALIVLPVSFLVRMPSMGILMFILFMGVSFVAHRFSKQLEYIDKNTSSYTYLTQFDQWVKDMITLNTKLSKFFYPYVFIAMVSGFWFLDLNEDIAGNMFVHEILNVFPNTYLVFGIPLFLILIFILCLGLLAYFGGKIGKWDINLVYGGILNRLEELLTDMKELQANSN